MNITFLLKLNEDLNSISIFNNSIKVGTITNEFLETKTSDHLINNYLSLCHKHVFTSFFDLQKTLLNTINNELIYTINFNF